MGDVTRAELGNYENWFLKSLLERTLLDEEVRVLSLSLFLPSTYKRVAHSDVQLLLIISGDVNLLSSSDNVSL
jgi:hypothetical protein